MFFLSDVHQSVCAKGNQSLVNRFREQVSRDEKIVVIWRNLQRFHLVGLEKEYCHMERLTNLDKLPRNGFTLSCFPLKVARGSAGPARVVAMIET